MIISWLNFSAITSKTAYTVSHGLCNKDGIVVVRIGDNIGETITVHLIPQHDDDFKNKDGKLSAFRGS